MANAGEYLLDPKQVVPVSKSAEGIMDAKFIPWQNAALLGDLFTRAGVTSLLTHLVSEGRLVVSIA